MNPILLRRVLQAWLSKAPTVPVEVQTLTNAWALTSAFVVGLQTSNRRTLLGAVHIWSPR